MQVSSCFIASRLLKPSRYLVNSRKEQDMKNPAIIINYLEDIQHFFKLYLEFKDKKFLQELSQVITNLDQLLRKELQHG